MARIAWCRTAGVVTLLVLLAPAVAVADAPYTAARKLGRGLAGITLAFLEPPGSMVQLTRERGPAWGLTLGLAQGVGKIVPRVLVGVYETLSAPFEAPAGFRPILDPEFTWDYFEEPQPR